MSKLQKVKLTMLDQDVQDKFNYIDGISSQLAQKAQQSDLDKTNNILSNMRDPLAYLNSVTVLCSFSARGQTTTAWIQGFSINEDTNEIYVAVQENSGNYLTIEIRNLDGSFKESKTLTIASGAYTEALPFFYNTNNELCFIVRTQTASTYAVYNYTTGVLGSPVSISGTPYKSALDGNYFITCDATSSYPYTLTTIYVYDWASIQAGTPSLLNSFRVTKTGSALVGKAQGIVLNNGYIFLTHGESSGNPAVTVYNIVGQLINTFLYTKESLANAINAFSPNALTDLSGYSYENESGCKYKGKLACAQLANGIVYICVHNSPNGSLLETQVPVQSVDTGWLTAPITFLNGAIQYDATANSIVQIRRIGNIVQFKGAVKGIVASNQEFIDFTTEYAPPTNQYFIGTTSNNNHCNWVIQTNGRAKMTYTQVATLDGTQWYPFNFTWFI